MFFLHTAPLPKAWTLPLCPRASRVSRACPRATQPARAPGCLCARRTTGRNHGTPASHPAAEQPAAPYKQLLCESHSNCSVSRRSSGREQKWERSCQRPGPGKQEMSQRWVQPGQDISSMAQFQVHSVLLPIWWPCIVPFLSYRCLELAHSSRDNSASSEQ